MNAHDVSVRPEGPILSSPGRQAGEREMTKSSAEGAALLVLQVPRLRRSVSVGIAIPA